MSLDCEVVTTRSGAPAMRDRTTGEVMHPVVGPHAEVEALYVRPSRLEERLLDGGGRGGAAHATEHAGPEPLVLLDVGLGAGSNAIAAWHVSSRLPEGARRLQIVSFDRSLAALELALTPPHIAAFGFAGTAGDAARALLRAGRHQTSRTTWILRDGDLANRLAAEPAAGADVVFWDPFSPKANPELWTLAAFAALRRVCRDGATVHTYSGATATRAALLLAGFFVGVGEQLSAGKQSTVAATRVEDLSAPLDRRWFERLSRSTAPLPSDAPPDALERIASQLNSQTA